MDHIEKVKTGQYNFQDYKNLTPEIYQKSIDLAKNLKGKKIIHINSTQLGGGVSELLKSQIPLEQSLGLDSQWYIIKAPIRFFKITKKIHNLLQGEKGYLEESEKKIYFDWLNFKIASSFKKIISQEKPEIVVIHDPQPLPLIEHLIGAVPILRMHIDLSQPNPNILKILQPLIEKYKLVILSHNTYRPDWLNEEKTRIVMPAINPLTEKNKLIDKEQAEKILSLFGLDVKKPIASQVSRFDPWKDPLGVIKAYQIAKKEIPELQLILSGICEAHDDPQAIEIYNKVYQKTKNDPDVHLFFDSDRFKEISIDLFVNAVYTASNILIQKSLKEGFGLTVAEAMWKKKPVIGGKTKGIELQIKHNENGFLVSSPEETASYLIKLFKDEKLRNKIGENAYQSVKNKFLLSRFVWDHLRIYSEF